MKSKFENLDFLEALLKAEAMAGTDLKDDEQYKEKTKELRDELQYPLAQAYHIRNISNSLDSISHFLKRHEDSIR